MNMTQNGPATGSDNFSEQVLAIQLNDVEFEEIMVRNRTVSSSAIARAVSDAAVGEYARAIETLVTAISLIKQSKVAHDERCKILISLLQEETKDSSVKLDIEELQSDLHPVHSEFA